MAERSTAELERELAALAARVAALEAVIRISAGAVTVASTGPLTVSAGSELKLVSETNAFITCGNRLTVTTENDADVFIDGHYTFRARGRTTARFDNAYNLIVGSELTMSAGTTLTAGANRANFNFLGATTMRAPNLDVSADKLTLRADGDCALQARDSLSFNAKNVAVTAGLAATVRASNLDVNATRINARTDTDCAIQTRDFTVNASGRVTIKGSSDVSIQGSKLAQN